jgi:hypothetical protein
MTHITKHAGNRIERGDKTGLRTVLSQSEVMERMHGIDAVKVRSETFFWSERDECCLMVVTQRQGKVLVTVYEPNRGYAPWMSIMTKFLRLQQCVFKSTEVTTRNPLEGVAIYLVDRKPNEDIEDSKRLSDMLVLYYDFPTPRCDTFWTKEFHQCIALLTAQYISEAEPSLSRKKRMYIQICGNGWSFLCPVYVPFKLLQLSSPLD